MPEGREQAAQQSYNTLLGIPEVPKPESLLKRGGVWFESDHIQGDLDNTINIARFQIQTLSVFLGQVRRSRFKFFAPRVLTQPCSRLGIANTIAGCDTIPALKSVISKPPGDADFSSETAESDSGGCFTKQGALLKRTIMATMLAVLVLATPLPSWAQRLHPFLTGGTHSDGNGQFAGISGGGVFDVAHSWLSVGVEGDVFFSGGYAAGRAGPIAQINLRRGRLVQPFAIGGYKWGEGHGTVIGGGIDFRPRGRLGFRVSIEDIVNRTDRLLCGSPFPPCSLLPNEGNPYVTHAVSVQFGIAFR